MRKSLVLLIVACTILVMGITGCSENSKEFKNEYGVFLSLDNKNLDVFNDYRVIVIDATYFEKEDILKLKAQGHVVYTYLNIGSIETFREYYDDFKNITIGDYENWDEEKWIDVSNKEWQNFIIEDLALKYKEKGVDGFFVDNVDVYYNFQTEDIYEGIENILKELKMTDKAVIINGGDVFLKEYIKANNRLNNLITGVNQESVITSIDFGSNSFGVQDKETKLYYESYLEELKVLGMDIYLLEYTKDLQVSKRIENYCNSNEYIYYISDSMELD